MTAEPTHTLGEYLRQERERRGITLEQVASATKISIKLLQHLESDNYAELPAKPFIRGFVISYARFIGFNAQETLERYSQFIETKSILRPNRESGHSGYVFEKKEGDQTRKVLWLTMSGFILLGALALVILKPSLKHRKSSQIDKLKAVHTVPTPEASPTIAPDTTNMPEIETPLPLPTEKPIAAKPVHSPVPAPVPSKLPPVTSVEQPKGDANVGPAEDPLNSGLPLPKAEIKYKIIAKAITDVWVRFQCDDRPVTKFLMRKDKILVLRAKDKLKFQASNPNSMEYNYNNRGFRALSQAKSAVTRQGIVSLFLPPELVDNKEESAFLENSLRLTPGPSPTPSVSLSTD
jgi:cytoskeleton protein RodZ